MRRLLFVLAASVLLLAVACGDDSGSTQDDDESFDPPSTTSELPTRPTDGPAPDIDTLPEHTVVFSPDDVDADANGEPTTWTPSVRDVEVLDQTFGAYIEAHPELGLESIDEYVRQYVGTGEVGGTASVNALCDDSLDWEDELVVVDDGGTCFWQAEFSFFTLDVDSFTVNGVG